MKNHKETSLKPSVKFILFTLSIFFIFTACSDEDIINIKKKNKILVCHISNNQHNKLIVISKNAWNAHKAHGDIRLDDQDNDGFVPNNPCEFGNMGDCNDLNENINPDSEEICNNAIDDNCNGFIDELDDTCQNTTDTDGDGVLDSEDECPNEIGLQEFNGCPDSDGDGVADKDDDCPTVAGLKALNGCPDADGDGVKDSEDQCPNEAGPAANNGCPWPDTDGDGILDKDDNCPDVAGPFANNGCPETP